MSLTNIFIKVVGVLLILGGIGLLFTAIGAPLGWALTFINPLISVITGALMIGAGIVVIRGGTITA